MVRSRPFYPAIDFCKLIGVIVRMERPDVAISLYQKMELRGFHLISTASLF
jgi:pentatricopeptide repeat protein